MFISIISSVATSISSFFYFCLHLSQVMKHQLQLISVMSNQRSWKRWKKNLKRRKKPTAEFATRLPRRDTRLSSCFFAQLSGKWHAGQTFTLTRFLASYLAVSVSVKCQLLVTDRSCEKRDSSERDHLHYCEYVLI